MMAEARRPKSDKEKRFIKLGWQLIEHKFRYYQLDEAIIEDHEYDKLEREYDGLAHELELEPTASDMVGFDMTRPSCSAAADKILGRYTPPKPKETPNV